MGKFRKEAITIVLVAVIAIGGASYKLIGNTKKLEKLKEEKKEMLAMYLEDESGTFRISNSKSFPKEGYVLDHAECKNGGTVTQDLETKELSAKFSKGDSCNLYFAKEKLPLLDSILAKANDASVTDYNSGNTGEMYTFEHDETTQTTGWSVTERRDYRYIGKVPNNWLKFNDEDWRIIGIFTTEVKTEEDTSGNPIYEKQQLIKIIRNESIGNIYWDDYTDGSVMNEWTSASLKTLLNGNYYNTANSFNYTYKPSSSSTGTTITIPKGLNETARGQIAEVKWYLGGSSEYENLRGPDYYSFERGDTTCVTTGSCSGQTRSTNTIGKVGLMYPSDYIYTYANGVDNTCYMSGHYCSLGGDAIPKNGWLYNSSIHQWTISPYVGFSFRVFNVADSGFVTFGFVDSANAVRPSVYLKSDIKIVSGDGASSETAYILG